MMLRSIPVVRNDATYSESLKLLEDLVRSDKRRDDPVIRGLTAVISAYERSRFDLPEASPIELVRLRMEELGLSQNQVATAIEIRSGRMSEVMTRKRSLTLPMIRGLGEVLGIPAEALIAAYPLNDENDDEQQAQSH